MSTSPLEQILAPDRVRAGLDPVSRKQALEVASQLIGQSVPELDSHELYQSLLARERLGSTALGQGVALPHGRLAGCSRLTGALLTLKQPIDFDAEDNQPVDLLMVLVAPEEASQDHLNTLAWLAEHLTDPAQVLALRNATGDEELFAAALASTGERP